MVEQHTPGPWVENGSSDWFADRYEGLGSFAFTVISSDSEDRDVAIVAHAGHHEDPTFDANIRLVSAAPDLLEALELCVDRVEVDDPFAKELVSKARAAIAKATGS